MIKNSEKHGVSLLAYCLMPNHYHLLMRQEQETSISKFLQATFIAYTQFVNTREGHNGTLFQGRAQARNIESDDYAIIATRYIHLNPVLAHLVHQPEEWEYSDCKEWFAEDSCLEKNPIQRNRSEFRRNYFASGREYQRFITEHLNDQEMQRCIELYEADS